MTYDIPEGILADLRAYVAGNHPYPFGSFVTAVLANDLVGAFGCADQQNQLRMLAYAQFLIWEMPGRSGDPESDLWGSYEAVANTVARQREAAGRSKGERA
jgi:hypothetical protein